jgi:hypothetical protein
MNILIVYNGIGSPIISSASAGGSIPRDLLILNPFSSMYQTLIESTSVTNKFAYVSLSIEIGRAHV